MSRVLGLAFLLGLMGCAHVSEPSGPPRGMERVDVPYHALSSSTELTDGGDQRVYVENLSDALVIITGIRVTQCRGVRTACDVSKSVRVRLLPGQRRRVFVVRLRPDAPRTSYNLQYQYEAWRAPRDPGREF